MMDNFIETQDRYVSLSREEQINIKIVAIYMIGILVTLW